MSSRSRAVIFSVLLLGACGGRGPSAPTRESTFPSGAVQLSYALDLPPGRGPFPALVFGHGSGRVTKDAAILLSRQLSAAGYAVLRYDKRGVGGSGGTYEGVGVANSERVIGLLAQDMAAGVRFLASRPEIDPRRIGLIGASQAGWVMPQAAGHGSVRYMVLLSSPTVTVGEEIFYSGLAEGSTRSFEELSAALRTFTGPRGYDPRPHLQSIAVPGLWVLGAEDRSIPTRETIAVLAELAAAGKPYRWKVYEDAGHSLTDARTGASVDFLPEVLAFLAGH